MSCKMVLSINLSNKILVLSIFRLEKLESLSERRKALVYGD